MVKQCSKCKQTKDFSEFAKYAKSEDGLQATCKACFKLYRAQYKKRYAALRVSPDTILKCTACDQEKEAKEFNKSSASKTGYFQWCRECTISSGRQKNQEYQEAHGISRYSHRRRKRMQWLRSLKTHPCADCGKTYEPLNMDYDHLRDKTKGVTRMVLDNAPKWRVLEETAKCELVCQSCHANRTRQRREVAQTKARTKVQIINDEIISKARQNPCCLCGNQYEEQNMQFDHIDPSKKTKDICRLRNYKTKTLLKELEKCQTVCSNCHRIKSVIEQRMGLYSPRPQKKKRYVGEKDQECARCHETKEFAKFAKHAKTKSGHNSWCTPCVNEYKRLRRAGK